MRPAALKGPLGAQKEEKSRKNKGKISKSSVRNPMTSFLCLLSNVPEFTRCANSSRLVPHIYFCFLSFTFKPRLNPSFLFLSCTIAKKESTRPIIADFWSQRKRARTQKLSRHQGIEKKNPEEITRPPGCCTFSV